MSRSTEGALVNPIAAINQEAYNAAHSEAINLGISALTEQVTGLRTELDRAVEEAGDDFDVSKVTALKGDTDQATMGNLVEHHSRLTAMQEVLNQQRSIRAAVQRRARADGRDEDDPIYDHLLEGVGAIVDPPVLSRHVRAAMQERGVTDFVMAHRGNVSFDLDLDPRIYAAMDRGAPGAAPNQWDSAASPPWSPDTGRTVMLGRAALSMMDIVPSGTLSSAQHIYYREESPGTGEDAATAASAAAARAEGAALAESDFKDVRVADTAESIGHRAKVTMEQLEDSARIQSMLDTRMPYGVRQVVNREMLIGTGVSPRIGGFLRLKYDGTSAATRAATFGRVTVDASDSDTDAKAGKAAMVAGRKAMTTLLVQGASMASAIVMHPTTVENIQLTETASAGFYYGDPRAMPAKVLWGLPIVEDQYGIQPFNSATAANQVIALLGDFAMQSELLYRHGVRVEFGMSADDFDRLRESVRAYVRAVLSIYRTKAFATIETVA